METSNDQSGKKKNDFAIDPSLLDSAIEDHKKMGIQEGKLSEALDGLLNLEKQTRLGADVTGTKKLVLAILQLCRQTGSWATMNEQIILLTKRRAQLKQAIIALVQEAMSYIGETPNTETRVDLIKTLNTVTAGKIFVEIERARLVRKLAKIKEDQGNVQEAAEIMQEVAVETFGAMDKREKIAFILEQVRLCLDHGDYMKAQILAKKINPRAFAEEGPESQRKKKLAEKKSEDASLIEKAADDVPPLVDLKLIYYTLMIRYHKHSNDYLEACRCYQSIYETSSVKEDPSQWMPVLTKICWYIVLSPQDSMQSSLLHSTHEDKKMQELPKLKSMLKKFITKEVIGWNKFVAAYDAEIKAEADIFGETFGSKSSEDLRLRVIQHNILVVSKYYSRITLTRLAELLDLSSEETEKHFTEMVVAHFIQAKVDRPAGIITFRQQVDSNEILNGWAANIEQLLSLVETSCHQIHKEVMVHKVVLKA